MFKTAIQVKWCNFCVLHLTQPWICMFLLFGFPIVSSFSTGPNTLKYVQRWQFYPFIGLKYSVFSPFWLFPLFFLLRWPNRPNEPSEPESRLHRRRVFSYWNWMKAMKWWAASGRKMMRGWKMGDRRKSFIFLTVIIELSLDLKLVLIWGRWRSNGRALPPGGTFLADAQSQHWLADDEDWELLGVSEAACAASSHCFLLGKEQFWSKVVKTERCLHGGFIKSTCVDSAFRFSSWSCIRMT